MSKVYIVRARESAALDQHNWAPRAVFNDYDEMQAYITKVEQYYPKSHGKYDRYVDYDIIDPNESVYPNTLYTVLVSLDCDNPVTKEEIEWEYDDRYEEPVVRYIHSYMREAFHIRVMGYDNLDILLECAQQERQRLLSRVYCPVSEELPHDIISMMSDQGLLKHTETIRCYRLPGEAWYATDGKVPIVCKVDGYDHVTAVKIARIPGTEYFYARVTDYTPYNHADAYFWGNIPSRNDVVVQAIRNPVKTLSLGST